MRDISAAAQAALEQRNVRIRDFVRFTVRDSSTGDPVVGAYWSDVGNLLADIINPQTGVVEQQLFQAGGTLIGIDPIPLVSNLSVQGVPIQLNQLSDADALIRAYDAKQGRVEVFRGLFQLDSMEQIAPAYPRFLGFIDEPEVLTPPEGEVGGTDLDCVSDSQEVTRSNPATRSDAHQRLRSATDSFRRHAAVVATWEIKFNLAL